MASNRVILLVLCGLCLLAGVACAFLGFTGQQGMGIMSVLAAMCLGTAGPGLACALLSKQRWVLRALVYCSATLLGFACLALMLLKVTGKDFSQHADIWQLQATTGALAAACATLFALATSIAVLVHGIRVVSASDPLGPLDWGTQSERYRQQLASGGVQPAPLRAAGENAQPETSERGRFIPGISKVSPNSVQPAGSTQSPSVPDGVLPSGSRPRMSAPPVAATTSHVPLFALAMIALLAAGGAGGLWYFTKGPRAAHASVSPVTTVQTLTFPDWGFGFDVPGTPFEQIDPQQFSGRAVLAVTRKDPAMRFYVIAEKREDNRTLEESVRVLREAMADIAAGATTLLDSEAQLVGVRGWRLLTRVRVGATDTFYCHWLGEIRGVSLQLWVVGTGRDAQSFAREADALFDRFFLLAQPDVRGKDGAAAPESSVQTAQTDKPDKPEVPKAAPASKPAPASTNPASTKPAANKPPVKPAQKPSPTKPQPTPPSKR